MSLTRRGEMGYMYEFPLILMGILFLLSIILPRLSHDAARIVLAVATVPVLAVLYYMLITPGWQPNAKRLRPPWNWLVFGLAATGAAGGIILYW